MTAGGHPAPATSPRARLFDAHCHLQAHCHLRKAAEVGVAALACNGCWQDDWARVAELCADGGGSSGGGGASSSGSSSGAALPTVVPNFGLHPWWVARRSPDWLERLRAALLAHPTAGLGECGLDRGPRCAAGYAEQLEAFEAQLMLAQELQRPVSVHCVRAYGAVHDALRRLALTVPVVLHSWTGAAEMTAVLAALRTPVYFSLSGHLLKQPPAKALPMVRAIPLDRLMIESDSPDGALDPPPAWLHALPQLSHLPGELRAAGLAQLNRPCVLRWTLQLVAAAAGRPEEEVACATWDNACRVFGCTPDGVGAAAKQLDSQG